MNLFELIANHLVLVPVVVFYAWLPFFAWEAWRMRHRKWQAVLLAAIAIAPIAVYAREYVTIYVKRQIMNATIVQAQQWPKLSNPPRALVIHGRVGTTASDKWPQQLVEMGVFDEAYFTQDGKTVRLTNERSPACGNFRDWFSTPDIYRSRAGLLTCAISAGATQVPDDGLHLYLGSAPRPSPGPLGPVPLPISRELRMITGDRQQIVGYWAIPDVEKLRFPPIFTVYGFLSESTDWQSLAVPNYGELSFVIERLELKPGELKPRNLPSPDEVRAEFIRRRDSPDRNQQRLATRIAAAVGDSALTANDLEPLLASDAIRQDLASEIGHEQFCRNMNRLCDFRESLIAACKQKRVRQKLPEEKCDRLPLQCNWCATEPLCQTYVTGKTTGCSPADAAAREAFLRPLSQGP